MCLASIQIRICFRENITRGGIQYREILRDSLLNSISLFASKNCNLIFFKGEGQMSAPPKRNHTSVLSVLVPFFPHPL